MNWKAFPENKPERGLYIVWCNWGNWTPATWNGERWVGTAFPNDITHFMEIESPNNTSKPSSND